MSKSKAKAMETIKNNSAMGGIGMLVEIPVAQIKIGAYQKRLSMDRVRKIVDNFDINRMRPIDVSYRDGEYWCFDGQHRINVYQLKGWRSIPAIIHYGLTYEDEAFLFARQQENVGAVNVNHKWNALVEAKDPETLEIVKICNDWGFEVLARTHKGHNIKCVKLLRDFYRDLGDTALATTLYTIGTAWDYMPHSVDNAILGGMYIIIKTYRDDGLSFKRLGEKLAETTPKLILRDMEDKFHSIRGEQRRAAYQILALYNKGAKAKYRLNPELLK